MEEIISKEELIKAKTKKGEGRGMNLRNIGEYVLMKEGEGGLKKLEDLIKSLGYPIEYKKIDKMDFYPIWVSTVSFLATEKLFNFTNKNFQEMGEMDAKFNLFIKVFINYFISLKTLTEASSKIIKHFAPQVEVESKEFNEKEKYAILRIKNFDISKYHCQYFIGFANAIIKMASKENPICEETKCPLQGDDCHEFTLRWS